jgi:NmrA-like family
MIKPRIIVTGATGKTGSVVTTELLKAGYPVRAMVHREDHRSARLRAQGADRHKVSVGEEAGIDDRIWIRHGTLSYRPTGPELLDAEDMAKAIGRAVARSVRVVPTPIWPFMKTARAGGMPIELMSNVRYYIEDQKRGAFELGAPTTDVLDVTGRPPEDFETIARRYAALPDNRRTFKNWLRTVAQFLITPLSPGFNFDRYDLGLRRPFPSEAQFARESKLWQREHGIAEGDKPAMPMPPPGRAQSVEF